MNVYKRGNTYWYSFVLDGVRVQRSAKVGDRRQAELIGSAYRLQLIKGEVGLEDAKRKRSSVGELLDALKTDYEIRGKLSSQTRSHIARARADFGSKMASEFNAESVRDYIFKRQRRGDADASINRTTQLVAQSFTLAGIPIPKIPHLSEANNARKGFFNDTEFWAVHANLPSDLKDFCEFAYRTSWRRKEIRSLEWSDVEGNVIHLRAQHAKSGKARKVPIEGPIVPIVARRRAARLFKGKLTSYIFHRDGEQVGEFRKSWRSACKAAGVSRIFHDLRRSAIRNHIRAGTHERVCMELSGHLTRSTFDRYNIANEADLGAAMERLGQSHGEQATTAVR